LNGTKRSKPIRLGKCHGHYIIQVENDEELINMGVVKGEDTYVDSSRIHKYIDKYSGNFISGGPTANSISMVSSLGGKSAFIGKVANDSAGKSFLNSFERKGIIYNKNTFDEINSGSGICILFVTPDGQRSIWYGNETYTVKAYSTEVKDTTGAGDAFAGGFLYALNKGYSMLKSAKIASYCGSLAANKIGARLPSNISLPENLKEVV